MKITRTFGSFAVGALMALGGVSQAHADAKGEKIMREALVKLNAAQTMTAKFVQTTVATDKPFKLTLTGTIAAMKPNFVHVRIAGETPNHIKLERVYAATGAEYITYIGESSSYRKDKLEPQPKEFSGEWEAEVDGFFGGVELLKRGTPVYKGAEKVGNALCDVITFTASPRDGVAARVMTYYIGQKDRLFYRASYPVPSANNLQLNQTNTLTDINLSAKLSAKDFAYTPPSGAKPLRKPREVIQRNDTRRSAF